MSLQLPDKYAADEKEAKPRADSWKSDDPFPDVANALLSIEHVKAYVKATGMVVPFYDETDRLKAASYEINPGGKFIRWRDKEKIIQELREGDEIVLPPTPSPSCNSSRGSCCPTTSR